jgi:Na+-driven multidrug efflux pump/anti-sigma regulatory factor (Ser/Thr protein kinase)
MYKSVKRPSAGGGLMLRRLFFKLLPVQAAIIAMGGINSIVDGVAAARFISPETVGVVGLYYSMLRILEATGSILLGGTAVFSGKYLGSGKIDRARGVCTLGMAVALTVGLGLSAVSLFSPGTVAGALGASAELREALSDYVRGYAIGIVPLLVGQQGAACLQLERQERRGKLAVLVMIAVNTLLDLLLVGVWRMGVWGLALATSLANWAYFLVVFQHFTTKDAQLSPSPRDMDRRELLPLLKTGFPNALLVICLAARSLVINSLLLRFAGEDGLSAMASFNMVVDLILAVAMGAGALVRMLSSVLIGEENREGLLALARILVRNVSLMMLGVAVGLYAGAPVLAGVFFPDTGSAVYELSRQLFTVYSFCVLLSTMCIAWSSYFQAAGHGLFVNLISVVDGFFSMVVPALLLSPRLGALGVWLAFPIGLGIVLALTALYPVVRLRRLPRSPDEWLLIPPDFGAGEHLMLELYNMEDVVQTALNVQRFCDGHGLSAKIAAHAGLCLEEMAGNIVRHGFGADRYTHCVEVRAVPQPDGVVLRIKDDCIAFNPREWQELTVVRDPCANVGIRLVFALAEEVSYQNLLGLNVLTIRLNNR